MGGYKVTPEKIEKVKKLGNETKLNNIEIGKIVDVSRTSVSRILRGHYDIPEKKSDENGPWYKKFKEIQNRPIYDVISKLARIELKDKS